MAPKKIAACALLALLCLACNNRLKTKSRHEQNGTTTSSIKQTPPETQAVVTQDLLMEDVADGYAAPSSNEAKRMSQTGAKQNKVPLTKAEAEYPDANRQQHETRDFNTEDYDPIVENTFLAPRQHPLSTFSIDVDEASYSNVRRYLQNGSLPPAGAVRIEEMLNYFDYDYAKPAMDAPFTVHTEIGTCPWNTDHKLVHVGLQGKEIPVTHLPLSNLVFLIDVSGSMDDPAKLPLVQASLKLLTDQLRENDNIAIVVYAGSAGLVLPSTSGANKIKIKEAISNLKAGGSTAGGEGIRLAYRTAREAFIKGGNNRVILATDGDFNVGASSDAALVQLIEKEREGGIFLSVLGYGMGNYKDNKMQQLADKGNGNHSYIDNLSEAKKVLVSEFGSTLFTIAKDVKIQVEFNPARVQAYRLIGYENRLMAAEDFIDDKKDAGELGSGHTVTALYEVIPVGVKDAFTRQVDSLKYQRNDKAPQDRATSELMTIKLRYKKPDENTSMLLTQTVLYKPLELEQTSDNFRFSAAVAEFGMLLRESKFSQNGDFRQVLSLAKSATGKDVNGYRAEFIRLVSAGEAATKNIVRKAPSQ
jgi:Ca-activated chloride channel family protein